MSILDAPGIRPRASYEHASSSPFLEVIVKGSGAAHHLVTSAEMTAPYVLGIGVDHDGKTGQVISVKRAGTGLNVDQWPAGSVGTMRSNRSSTPIENTDIYAGAGGVQWALKSGAHFKDGAITSGSTTLTSETAVFTAGDLGKVLQSVQPYPNDIPAGTTIAAIVSATEVTLSAAAAATRSGLTFRVAGRSVSKTVGTGQRLWRVYDEDSSSTVLYDFRAGSWMIPLPLIPKDAGSTALRIQGASGQANDLTSWRDVNTNRLSRINKDGRFLTSLRTAPVVSDVDIHEVTIHWDSTSGAEKFYLSGRNAAGNLVTKQLEVV